MRLDLLVIQFSLSNLLFDFYLLAGSPRFRFNPGVMKPSEQRQALLRFLEATPDPVLGVAPDGGVTYANAAGRQLLRALDSAVGQALPAPLAPLTATTPRCVVVEVCVAGNPASLSPVRPLPPDAPLSPADLGSATRRYLFSRTPLASDEILFLHGHEVTFFQEREEALEQELAATRELALHDPLTGLANRVLLDVRLRQALARYPRQQLRTAVAYLDLDNFKQINERHGHPVGDRVLAAVARCAQQQVRPTDTLARVGGDEMVLVLPEIDDLAEAKRVCTRLQAALLGLEIEGLGQLSVGVSIGLALHPEGGVTPEQLLRHADQALAAAKAQGAKQFVIFSDQIHCVT